LDELIVTEPIFEEDKLQASLLKDRKYRGTAEMD
jgi:hypothetical protein